MPSSTFTAGVRGAPDLRGPARSYQRLLDRPLRDDTDQWATLRPAEGSTGASFPAPARRPACCLFVRRCIRGRAPLEVVAG